MSEDKNVKASDAAKELAEKEGIDLAGVKPTGAGGNVVVGDVERAVSERADTVPGAATEGATGSDEGSATPPNPPAAEDGASDGETPDERLFEAKINPELYGTPVSVRIGEKVYQNGTPVTQAELDVLKGHKSGATAEHPGGVQYVLKGKEITS